jgi:hypothetical protein
LAAVAIDEQNGHIRFHPADFARMAETALASARCRLFEGQM